MDDSDILDDSDIQALIRELGSEDSKVRRRAALTINEIADSMVNKGDYFSALKIINKAILTIMEFYKGKKDRNSLWERRRQLAKFADLTQQIHDKMNTDKKTFHKPVKHQSVRTVRKKVKANG